MADCDADMLRRPAASRYMRQPDARVRGAVPVDAAIASAGCQGKDNAAAGIGGCRDFAIGYDDGAAIFASDKFEARGGIVCRKRAVALEAFGYGELRTAGHVEAFPVLAADAVFQVGGQGKGH